MSRTSVTFVRTHYSIAAMFDDLHKRMDAKQRNRATLTFNHNTRAVRWNGCERQAISIILHHTTIVRLIECDYPLPWMAQLDHGDWQTAVTMDRIRAFLPNGWRLDGSVWTSRGPKNFRDWTLTCPHPHVHNFERHMFITDECVLPQFIIQEQEELTWATN